MHTLLSRKAIPWLATALVAVLAFTLGATLVARAQPSSGGGGSLVFSACLTNGGSLIHVTTNGPATCSSGQTAVSWNEAGPPGPAGGVSGYEQVTQTVTVPAHGSGGGTALCPAGKVVVGGGYFVTSINTFVFQDEALSIGTGWVVTAHNTDAEDATLTIRAVCVTPATTG